MQDIVFKITHPFKYKKAVQKLTSRMMQNGTWCERTIKEFGVEFWIVCEGNHGWSVGEPIQGTNFRVYGEV